MTYARVQRLWPGETFVCIGGGPSLTPADVDRCRGRARVIAINDAYRLAPWADVLYACDAKWWRWQMRDRSETLASFAGLRYSIDPDAGRYPGVQILRNAGPDGLALQPDRLKHGRNSGYQAINLAVHLGARQIVLLGYDMQRAEDGRTHWFGSHPQGHTPFGDFLPRFSALVEPLRAVGVSVVNCSRRTALTAFPLGTLDATFSLAEVAA